MSSSSPLLQYNPQDPLNKRTEPIQQLYKGLCAIASGFPMEHVTDAAFNLLVNSLRQNYAQRGAAEQRGRMICEQFMQILMDHYDPVTGRRRSIFPHNQVVVMPHHIDKDKIGRG